MLGLSKNQTKILETITLKINKFGYPPSIREICNSVGLRSTSTVHFHMNKLEELGYIKRDSNKPRAIEVLSKNMNQDIDGFNQEIIELPVIKFSNEINGIEEIVTETIKLPANFIIGQNNFLFKVNDDKLIETGVFKNDYIVIERTKSILNGTLVMIKTNNEISLGRYFKDFDCITLEFENKTYEPLKLKEVDFNIIGKIAGCFRVIK